MRKLNIRNTIFLVSQKIVPVSTYNGILFLYIVVDQHNIIRPLWLRGLSFVLNVADKMFTKFNRLIYRFERRYIVRTTLCDKSFVLPFINFLSRNINICKYILNIYSQYVLHKCDCSMQRII